MGKKRKADEEDEDVEEDLEDEDSEEDSEDPKAKKKKKSQRLADDDDDGDEGRGKKQQARKRNVYIDDIADVEDDEEEEEDDEDGEEGLIDDRDEIAAEEANTERDHFNHRQLDREQRDERTPEEIARELEERYNMQHGEEYEEAATGVVGQQAMLPTFNDPKLWLIHCRPGHERELITQLLQKHYTLHKMGTPLTIKTALCLDHLKGYIYIEADKEAAVRDAIKGLRNVFISKGVQLVPLDQMVDAITVNRKAKAGIARDNWVRVRNGLYKDDLAKVVEIDSASQKATIRLVPRLDLHAMANRANDEEARKKNPFGRTGPVRPPPKPFNAEEARQLALSVSRTTGVDGQTYLMVGSHRFANGYVERDVAIKSLNVIEGAPPVEDLQRWNACGAAAEDSMRGGGGAGAGASDLSSLVAALPIGSSVPKTFFLKGDLVAIVKGELKTVQAIVDNVRDDGKVMVRPKVESFDEAVDFDNEDLRKVFEVGDRVRVISGPYQGEIGIVLQVAKDHDQCIIISDATKQELKTFGRDMTTTDVSNAGVEVLGEYQLHDLVQLDQHTAGVIINIQRESARVLTTASAPEAADIRVVRAPDIQRLLKVKNMKTSDMNNNEISQNDYVTFTMGNATSRNQSQGGSVAYVWRGQLFLKSNEFADSGGFVCVRANKCKLRGAKVQTGVDLARQVAAGGLIKVPVGPSPGGSSRNAFQYMPASPSQYAGGGGANVRGSPSQVNASPGRNGPGGGFRPPPPRMGGGGPGSFSGASHHAQAGSSMIGRTVRVCGGQYNGYRGRVKHETGTHVQLELDAISGRIVTVDKKHARDEAGGNASYGAGRPAGFNQGGRPGTQQPTQPSQDAGGYGGNAYGNRTPSHPSQTPLHPSMTPAHYSSQLTPAHAPYTPMHAPTPMDDNYYMLNEPHQDIRGHPSAYTPGMGGTAYTPSAFTPSAPSPSPYGDHHHAPTPALDPGTVGPPPVAGTPGLAATPGLAGTATAPTPYLSAPTPALGPDGMGATPGMDGMGTTPGVAPTPHVNAAYTPHLAATPVLHAGTPGLEPHHYQGDYSLWEGLVVKVSAGARDSLAVVKSVGHGADGNVLRVVRGTFPTEGASFVENPGAMEEEVHGDQLTLVRPDKKERIKVLVTDNGPHIGALGTVKGIVQGSECFITLDTNEMCIAEIDKMGKLADQTPFAG